MNISTRSIWHGDGRSTPSGQARGSSQPEIRRQRATGCVPQRAIGLASRPVEGQVRVRFEGIARPSGTGLLKVRAQVLLHDKGFADAVRDRGGRHPGRCPGVP